MNDPLFIPAKITKVSQENLLSALAEAYKNIFNSEVSFESLGILWTQIALETGRLNSCYNWNLGNIRRTKNHLYTMYKCSEIIGGKEIFYYPPAPESQFNAYISLSQACQEHLSFLQRDRYAEALKNMKNGEYKEYCRNLKAAGYFTASLERYQTTFLKLFDEYQKKYKEWYQLNCQSWEPTRDLPLKL